MLLQFGFRPEQCFELSKLALVQRKACSLLRHMIERNERLKFRLHVNSQKSVLVYPFNTYRSVYKMGTF
jgi:hypothetical protein